MTEDRIFKNKVKEVAELNELTYTEAKKAVIELNRILEEYNQGKDSCVTKMIDQFDDNPTLLTLDCALFEEPMNKKSLKLSRKYNRHIEGVELTSKPKPDYINFLPLKNDVKQVLYGNVNQAQVIETDEENLRLAYFTLIESFGKENSYFVDRDNFFSQMPKLIRTIETYDGKDDLLVGIVWPADKTTRSKMNSNKLSTMENFVKKIDQLLKIKNFCLITNFVEDNENIKIIDYVNNSSGRSSVSFDWDDNKIKYYPFNKVHGGSYSRSTNQTVLGYVEGKSHFSNSSITLIEVEDNESCIEEIYAIEESDADFIHWEQPEDMTRNESSLLRYLSQQNWNRERGIELSNNSSLKDKIFLKIGFEMVKDELIYFLKNAELMKTVLCDHFGKEMVIETVDAEIIQSHLEEQFKEGSTISRYTLMNDHLYNEETGEISLYKA